VRRLLIAQGIEESEILRSISQQAQARQVRSEHTRRSSLDAQVSGASHQGVVLETGPYPYADLNDIFTAAAALRESPLILLLDLIQDVQNVGTLLRTAEAVGVHGVIIQERRAAGITPAVVSASSGAVEHLNVVQVTNLVRTMEALKERGVWLAGLDLGSDAVRFDASRLDGALGLVVGSEGKGLRRLVRDTCDFIVYLPMRGQVESLNASTAWQARHFAGER
jgi:23S rRNA (guanosine2251-2'-O)-methyltransferase